MKRALRIISILTVAAVFLSSCTVNLKKKTDEVENIYEEKYDVIDRGPVKGGSVRLFSTPVDTLNPLLTNNAYVQDFLGLVFEGLYTLDSTQKPVPVLAKAATFSPDGLTLSILLKNNIKWHDKMEFKSDDVVFTINTIMDPKNNSIYAKNTENIESVSKAGNDMVIIKLKQPYSFMLNKLTFPIIPVHRFVDEKISDKNSKVNLAPVGTGLYCFGSYNSKAGVKLKLNEDWWASGQEDDSTEPGEVSSGTGVKKNGIKLPYISSIEIKIFNNSNSANAAFQSRDIDVLPAEYGEYRKYLGRTDINLKRYAGRNYEFLSLNIKKGPLADKRIRNALNYFLDKKKLVDTAASGIATTAEIPVNPNSWVYQLVNFDKASNSSKAKELMTQSGYTFDSKKNRYVKKGTKSELKLKLIVNDDNSLRNNVASEIAAQLGKSGITVEVVKVPWDNVKKTMDTGAYDLAFMGYRLSSAPDLSFAYSTAEIQTGLNVSGYSNPAVDAYLQQILSKDDVELQKSAYIGLLNIVLDERPYIGLFFLNESMMYGKNIRGEINPYIWNKYYDISQWYIP